jgi:hypothetical protein
MTKKFLTGLLLATALGLAAIPSTPQEAIAQTRDLTAPKPPPVWCRQLRLIAQARPKCSWGVAACEGGETRCRLTLQREGSICLRYRPCFPG